MKVATFVLGVVVISSVAFAERQSFDRYQSVVDRQMFGPPPEGFDPTKHPSEAVTTRAQQKAQAELTKEQQKLKSAIRFSMINMTPAGETAVGFTDSSDAKNPKNYYLKVGESRDGWTVKEADAAKSSMTIVKGDIEVSLTIGGDSGKGGGKTASVAANAPFAQSGGGQSLGSLRMRRSQRRAEEQARMDEQRKQLQAQQAAFEKRQQEDRQAREAEKAQQDAQREEQRKQLLQIQEELRKAREAKDREKPEKPDSETEENQ